MYVHMYIYVFSFILLFLKGDQANELREATDSQDRLESLLRTPLDPDQVANWPQEPLL